MGDEGKVGLDGDSWKYCLSSGPWTLDPGFSCWTVLPMGDWALSAIYLERVERGRKGHHGSRAPRRLSEA